MSETIYKPSGIKIEVISKHDDGDYFMVRSSTSGKVFFAHKDQVEQQEIQVPGASEPALKRRGRRPKAAAVVKPQVPTDNRINLNTLTKEGITQVLPGVGIKTAQEIIELKGTLPGEKFSKLDQLTSIKKVDWEAVFESNLVYVE